MALNTQRHPIPLHSGGKRTRRKASILSVGFRHAMDWDRSTSGLNNFLAGTIQGGNMIGGGVKRTRGGVVGQLSGGESAGKLPGGQLGKLGSQYDHMIEYLIAVNGIKGTVEAVNPALPTRRWLYGSLKKGSGGAKKHSAGDAHQKTLEDMMAFYANTAEKGGKLGATTVGEGDASKPISGLWASFYKRLIAFINKPEHKEELENFKDDEAQREQVMQQVTEAGGGELGIKGDISGKSYTERAGDLFEGSRTRTVKNLGQATGGAEEMDQIAAGESVLTEGAFRGLRVTDIAEGNWENPPTHKAHHGKGSRTERQAWLKESKENDLTSPKGISGFYNKYRIPQFNKVMQMITEFAQAAAGDANSPGAKKLRAKSGETADAWYRRQAVFYASQIDKIAGGKEGTVASRKSALKKEGFGGSKKSIYGPAGSLKGVPDVRPRPDGERLPNPYSQTERGKISQLHKVLEAGIQDNLYAGIFDSTEKASLDDITFVLHHMGNIGADYGDQYMKDQLGTALEAEGLTRLTEYGEVMAFTGPNNEEWTLAINFYTYKSGEKKGQFRNLSAKDVGIIQESQLDIYMSTWENLPEGARFEALDLAVISGQTGSVEGWLSMSAARAEIVKRNGYRFTCRGDAAIPAILDVLMENFLLSADAGMEQEMKTLKRSYKGIGERFSERLRKQIWGKLGPTWPGHAWGAGASTGRVSDLIHSSEQYPPAFYVGKDATVHAEGHGLMAKSLGKGVGKEFLRKVMTAEFGETNWPAAMTEGRNVFGTYTSQEEATEIISGSRQGARGGYFGGDGDGLLRGRMGEGTIEALQRTGAFGAWVPNKTPAEAARAYVSFAASAQDLGFIWALPYATWDYARLGGSTGTG